MPGMEYDKLEKGAKGGSGLSSIHTLPNSTHTPYTPPHSATRARHGHHHTRSDSQHFTSALSRSGGKPLSFPGYFDDLEEEKDRRRAMSPKNIGRAIGARFVRAVKRGNLPFMLVFTM